MKNSAPGPSNEHTANRESLVRDLEENSEGLVVLPDGTSLGFSAYRFSADLLDRAINWALVQDESPIITSKGLWSDEE